jgi:dipeptidyl aminopeptidase/acylaminoacyl peptidase
VLRDNDYDFAGSFYRDPASRALVGVTYGRDGPTTRWFDDTYRDLQKVLNGYFPGKIVQLLDGSTDGGTMLVGVNSDRDPTTYYTLNLSDRTIGRLQSELPWINPELMQPMSIFKYRTADGKRLDAYVTLPRGASTDNPAPLVVLPHGGPWIRNSWGFHGEVQFLASRGFAVLQPNYRGSTGYDWMFTDYDRVDFLGMHDDVTRATKALLKTGMVDANRVAIVGGGFGGYLAVTGLVDEPGLYRCGATYSGIFDWAQVAHVLGLEREQDPLYGELFQLLGDPAQDQAGFELISPIKRIGKLRDPLLVARERDAAELERVESDDLLAQLRNIGARHEEFLIEGSMAARENRVALFERIVAFLNANL